MAEFTVVDDAQLQHFASTHEFVGEDHGTDISFILVDMPAGDGVRLHLHPYQEVFIVQEGRATYRVGSETIEVTAPRTLIVPAGIAHGFRNSGDGRLKQVDIHVSPRFITEWLEPESSR
jgi:mannose-6-phosphate isomerase-like protein (cupin superfamily)